MIAPTMMPSPRSTLAVPMPPLMARSKPRVFATVAPVPAPTLPSSTTPSEALRHAAYPSSARGWTRCFRNADVEKDRRGHNRHRDGACPVSDIPLCQEPHHAGRRIEPERAPAAQDDGMNLRDVVGGPEQVGLASAGSRAANVYAPDCTVPAQHDGASATALSVGGVTDLDARYVGYSPASTHKKTSPIRLGEANAIRCRGDKFRRHPARLCNWCSPFRNGLAATRIIAGARAFGEWVA